MYAHSGTSAGRVYHFDLRDKSPQPAKCAPVHRRDVCNVQLSSDESTLACGGDDGDVSVWEPRAATVIAKLHAHKSGARVSVVSKTSHVSCQGESVGEQTHQLATRCVW